VVTIDLRYNANDAWQIVVKFAEELKQSRLSIRSVVLYNSLVREDFVENRSDVDVMAVVQRKKDSEPVKKIYVDICKRYGCGNEPWWELAKELFPLDFYVYTVRELRSHDFSIYYWDFIENHKVLFGENVAALVTKPNSKKAAALKFLSEAVSSSRDWNSPSNEIIKRHLVWVKFHPAYLAIECMKAVLLYHDIHDFNRNRLITNLQRVPGFEEESLAEFIIKTYLENRTCRMNFEKVKQLYPRISAFIFQCKSLLPRKVSNWLVNPS